MYSDPDMIGHPEEISGIIEFVNKLENLPFEKRVRVETGSVNDASKPR